MKNTTYSPHADNDFEAPELLSCPFCGSVARLTFHGNPYTKTRKVKIKCIGCRVEMVNAGISSSAEKLARYSIEAWNRRTSISAILAID